MADDALGTLHLRPDFFPIAVRVSDSPIDTHLIHGKVWFSSLLLSPPPSESPPFGRSLPHPHPDPLSSIHPHHRRPKHAEPEAAIAPANYLYKFLENSYEED